MPFKWKDTTERMMLIKFLEQNIDLKLNAALAVDKWPSDIEGPTKRSLYDRFNALKSKIRKGQVNSSLGQGAVISSSYLATPETVPSTPRLTTTQKSKIKAVANAAASSPNPISSAKGSSTTAFKSKLLGTETANAINGKRQRGNDTDSDEESMSGEDTGSNDETSDTDDGSTSPTKAPSAARANSRRSSLRRSKTPISYKIDDADLESDNDDPEEEAQASATEASSIHNGNIEVETEGGDDDTTQRNCKAEVNSTTKPRQPAHVKGNGSANKRAKPAADDSDEAGSDATFDPSAHRTKETGQNKKKGKPGWMDRIAMADDGEDDEMLDQD